MKSNLAEEVQKTNIMTFFDAILTLWLFTIASYLRKHEVAIVIIAGGITFLYGSFHIHKNGIFSRKVQALFQKIDKITFPTMKRNQNLVKTIVNISIMALLYFITSKLDMLAIFYYALSLYLVLLILFSQSFFSSFFSHTNYTSFIFYIFISLFLFVLLSIIFILV